MAGTSALAMVGTGGPSHMTPAAQLEQNKLFGAMFGADPGEASSRPLAEAASSHHGADEPAHSGPPSPHPADAYAHPVADGQRTSIDMERINHAHPDHSDSYRLGGVDAKGIEVRTETAVYDNTGDTRFHKGQNDQTQSGQGKPPALLKPGQVIKVNAGTLSTLSIHGKKAECTYGWDMQTSEGNKSGWVPLDALKEGRRIADMQQPIEQRLQAAIKGQNDKETGPAYQVKARPMPESWEQQGTLYTFPDQTHGQVNNKASYYFGSGQIGLFSSPPNPDYGVAIDLLADGTQFHAVGPVEAHPLYHSLPAGEKRPKEPGHDAARKPSGHTLYFAKGYTIDAGHKKIYGWINTTALPGFRG
jgi:hypothetical protein